MATSLDLSQAPAAVHASTSSLQPPRVSSTWPRVTSLDQDTGHATTTSSLDRRPRVLQATCRGTAQVCSTRVTMGHPTSTRPMVLQHTDLVAAICRQVKLINVKAVFFHD